MTCTWSRAARTGWSRWTTASRPTRAASTSWRAIPPSWRRTWATIPRPWRTRNEPQMSTALLSLESVTTYYAEMRILEGVTLQVGEGELVCLLGGNASGKSTTLKAILGIVRPRSGRVLLDGEDVTGWPVPPPVGGGGASVPHDRRPFGPAT